MIQLWPLYKLQQVDSKIAALDNKSGAADAGEELQKKIRIRERKLKEANDTLHHNKTALKDAELKLAGLDAKRRDIEKKMHSGTVTNFKELEGFTKDLEHLKAQASTLEDQVLAGMEQGEKDTGEIENLKARLEKAQKAYDEHLNKSADTRRESVSQLEELRQKRETMAAEIDAALLSRYESLRKRKQGVAIVKMEGNACGECGAGLPESIRKNVQARQLELCSNCERILFAD